ncbi:oligopeptide transport system ATP-binding protein [Sporobacter termitidis DSM 10068]|uniref:Oligopeptide transport system ATP-binding protein n=1 Tax=Sporobacter termitidis DSM 10068 TaxID=1123282 RepID=A0A1M5XCA2_9FIRM|nr:oligopeptide/dipeptide ABC transporter ATP-binding protein [Sporobacter termitidis]SHH97198.1 oligopeptide transport system ATP-binding protein [Sporobacter termitidis DSM 10068]
MSDAALLEVRDVKKYFPIKKGALPRRQAAVLKAVDGVSFAVARGETLGIIGESGCGKSTLARLIMGLSDPSGGDVIYDGSPVTQKMPLALRRRIQMVFQDPYASLDPRMSIRRIVEEPLRIHERLSGAEKTGSIVPVLEQVGLGPDALGKYPHEFSGGQRQRIGIARALVLNPEMLICDEPVSALDVSIQAQVLNLLSHLKKSRGLTYLFISHDISVIKHISDRVMVMYLGQVMELADKKTLFAGAAHPYTLALISAIPTAHTGKKTTRIILEGDLPSPIHVPPGCPFQTRCPGAADICGKKRPELRELSAGHYAACHFAKGCERI